MGFRLGEDFSKQLAKLFAPPSGQIDLGDANNEGASGNAVRADHTHGFPGPTAPPPALELASAAGASTRPARQDHTHEHAAAHHLAGGHADLTATLATRTYVDNALGTGIFVNATDPTFGATGDGVTDDTLAIQAAIDSVAAAGGGVVILPAGTYRITAQLVGGPAVAIVGAGTTANVAQQAPTTILKDGNFDGIKLGDAGALRNLHVKGATANGGDGIHVDKVRCVFESVTTSGHGQDGLRIGGKVNNTNANLARLIDVRCLSNTRHGIYVHDADIDGGGPNANSMSVLGLDIRTNGGDGIKIEASIDGIWHGLFVAENTGVGLRLASGAKGQAAWFPYLEANTAGDLAAEAGSEDCFIWGQRQGVADTWTNAGTNNVFLGRALNTDRFQVFPGLDFQTLRVTDRAISGNWELKQNAADRALEFGIDTANTPIGVRFLHNNGGVLVFDIEGSLNVDGQLTPKNVGVGINLPNGVNIASGQTTGSQIGTTATQKFGFFGATPVVRPTGVTVDAAGIHAALVSLGLIGA